jgi:putative holliday junction resolvase
MPKIIAIDYGSKRMGLAVTDDLQIIASGLTTVHSSELIGYLENYFSKNQVETIVVGLPKSLKNTDTDSSKEVQKLIVNLSRKFKDKKIETLDERFTSAIASRTISQSGMSKKKKQNKSLIDEISAVIILQDYLQQKSNGIRY